MLLSSCDFCAMGFEYGHGEYVVDIDSSPLERVKAAGYGGASQMTLTLSVCLRLILSLPLTRWRVADDPAAPDQPAQRRAGAERPLHLPYISPISPHISVCSLHLPHISPTSPLHLGRRATSTSSTRAPATSGMASGPWG